MKPLILEIPKGWDGGGGCAGHECIDMSASLDTCYYCLLAVAMTNDWPDLREEEFREELEDILSRYNDIINS